MDTGSHREGLSVGRGQPGAGRLTAGAGKSPSPPPRELLVAHLSVAATEAPPDDRCITAATLSGPVGAGSSASS